jgi:AraC-like DNA-binding protein
VRKFLRPSDPILPLHHPSLLVSEAVAQGADERALLFGTGISLAMLTSGEARISYEQYTALIRNALSLTRNPLLGVDFGRRIHLSHMGVLGLLMMSSANVAEAFEAGLKYYKSLAPAWDLTLDVNGRLATWTAREVIPRNPFRVFATETLLMAMQGFAHYLIPDFENAVHEVQVALPTPVHAPLYKKVFSRPVRFNCEHTRVFFDAELLSRPLRTADGITARWAERQCASQADAVSCHEGLIAQVRALLCANPGAYPGAEKIARTLQTSTRSLRRSLREMGTTYQQLLDDVRRAHAIEYVSATDLPCERIAKDLAFSDARSFRRAFRRWTGTSPSEFRVPRR